MINIVYATVRFIQFIVFLASFWVIYRIYTEKNTVKQRVLLLASICAVLNIYGYLEALSTTSVQSSQWATRSQLVSGLLFLSFMLHLIAMFCDYQIHKWQTIVLGIISGVFVVFLFNDENVNLLFHEFTATEKPLAIQIRYGLMPLGYVFMTYLTFLMIAILYVGIVVRQRREKDSCISLVAFSCVLPFAASLFNLAGVTGGFDLGPSLLVASCLLTYRYNKKYHFLDDGEIARETILDELGEGYIILDSERKVKFYNSIAAMLCPELTQPGESEVIVELIYLHNHDVLEHNGKICNIVVSELKENGDLTGYVMWLYDCTDEYYYMKDLEQIQEQASAADKTRDLFLHHMTHGFGSPLYIIKNRSDLIYQDERASADVKEMSLEVLEAGQKLEDMVAVMMAYSKDSHSTHIREAEYLTEDLVQMLQKMLEERRQGRCEHVQLKVGAQLPTKWFGSQNGIQKVVYGILRCAGIACHVSGLEVQISSEMRYADALIVLTLYLDDNGTTTAELNRLSTLAQKSGRKVDTEVNYIPYSMCKRLLLEMKGAMECVVERERSKIQLMFPQKILDNTPYTVLETFVEIEENEAEHATTGEVETVEKHQATVLVVDDNLLYLKEMDAWLRQMKLKTIMAKSGAECLRILERKQVDMVFMDQMMPEMDGTQTLVELRKLEQKKGEKRVPVVILTADDSAGARKKYLESGFDDYLAKPIEARQIKEQVRKYLNLGV